MSRKLILHPVYRNNEVLKITKNSKGEFCIELNIKNSIYLQGRSCLDSVFQKMQFMKSYNYVKVQISVPKNTKNIRLPSS
jgi:hypothetical protein